jgi:quercetin dioxygenase-like cupin family protein
MSGAAPSKVDDPRAILDRLDELVRVLGRAMSDPAARAALIEARRLRNIAQRWEAIPPPAEARHELSLRLEELCKGAGLARVGGADSSSRASSASMSATSGAMRTSSSASMSATSGAMRATSNAVSSASLRAVDEPARSAPSEVASAAASRARSAISGEIPAVLGGFLDRSPSREPAPAPAPNPADSADAASRFARRDSATSREASRSRSNLPNPAPNDELSDVLRSIDSLDASFEASFEASFGASAKTDSPKPPPEPHRAPAADEGARRVSQSGLALELDEGAGGSANRFLAPHRGQTIAGLPEEREELFDAINKARSSVPPPSTLPGSGPAPREASREAATNTGGGGAMISGETSPMSNRMRMAAAFGDAPKQPAVARPVDARPIAAAPTLSDRPARVVVAPGVAVVRPESARWVAHPSHAGVSTRVLYREPRSGVYTAMVKLAAGATIPARRHHSVEELFVVEGTATIGRETLMPGQYCRAEVDSVHPAIRSEDGCTLLLCGSENDEPAEEV